MKIPKASSLPIQVEELRRRGFPDGALLRASPARRVPQHPSQQESCCEHSGGLQSENPAILSQSSAASSL